MRHIWLYLLFMCRQSIDVTAGQQEGVGWRMDHPSDSVEEVNLKQQASPHHPSAGERTAEQGGAREQTLATIFMCSLSLFAPYLRHSRRRTTKLQVWRRGLKGGAFSMLAKCKKKKYTARWTWKEGPICMAGLIISDAAICLLVFQNQSINKKAAILTFIMFIFYVNFNAYLMLKG